MGYGTRAPGRVGECKACWDNTAEVLRWSNRVLYLLLWEQSLKSSMGSPCLGVLLEGAARRSLDLIRERTGTRVSSLLVIPVSELASRTSFLHFRK